MLTQHTIPLCSIEGCTRPKRKLEWCQTHYERWRRNGTTDLIPRVRPERFCTVEGCEKRHYVGGYCRRHHTTWQRHGNPTHPRETVIHSMTNTSTYSSWANMITRCRNPKATDYDRYGGRGITVCERWSTFANFLEDMGPKPDGVGPGGRALYSIERKANDGNYEPTNCRWATQLEQVHNRG